ncbi:protein root UVB sensitive 4 isoform X1 [Sesamum indicum]|uniref:Protein root UVB sensitive 4 isoform X1 n=1 Tax=Sesamum indicum TaxID=4182 RepID=A0A6I9TM71_SESIN|nr:protein root UVB sensitive 4 isoform X1 [Sesamum indicum]
MKLTIQTPSHSQLYPTWALRYDPVEITKHIKPKTSLKSLALSSSLNTSFNFSHEYQEEEKLKPTNLNDKNPKNFNLPVVIRHSGTVSRCFWDGKELKLVSVDGSNAFSLWDFSLDYEDGMRKLGRVCGAAVRNFFLPREVGGNYLEYVKWKFLHRVFSSALQVLATQAMFRAIGIGYSRSLPSAAALNWVLKDGLGRLSRCIYTASLASSFDTNLKRVRFATSVLFSLSIGVELLTPVFPKYFLLLATIANIAKQISLACYLATGSAVHRSFAIADNLGEVSAKAQIQTVCFDNVGLLLAATFNILFRNNQRLLAALPFVVYPIFSAIDLFGIYQGLKHVHLQTLTKDRLELIINIWIQQGCIPSPAEVSKREDINFLWSKGRELLPIRIGCLIPKRKIPKLSLMTLKSLKDDDFYFICMESSNSGSGIRDHGILLCLREGARTSDVITGLLQACYIRNGLLLDKSSWDKALEACDDSGSLLREWFTLMEESKKSATIDLGLFIDKMSGLGWVCRNILLSSQEQARYNFVAD